MDNALYRDIYNLHAERLEALEHGEPDFWATSHAKFKAMAEKYDNDVFCLNMLTAVFIDLEVRDNPTIPEVRLQAVKGLARLAIEWAMEAERSANT